MQEYLLQPTHKVSQSLIAYSRVIDWGRYITNMEHAAHAMGIPRSELQTLADATYTCVNDLRSKLVIQGKMLWLNGVDNADPFPLTYGSNCSAPYGQCGWWAEPKPGPGCVAYFRERCNNASCVCNLHQYYAFPVTP